MKEKKKNRSKCHLMVQNDFPSTKYNLTVIIIGNPSFSSIFK